MKAWLSSGGLPRREKVQTLVRIHPLRSWFVSCLVSRPASGNYAGFIKPATHTDEETARLQSPFAQPWCYLDWRDVSPSPQRALPHRHRSYGLMRPSPCLSCPSVYSLVPEVSAGCHTAPAANGMFPTLFRKSFPRCLALNPDGPTECIYLFLPRCHRPSLDPS